MLVLKLIVFLSKNQDSKLYLYETMKLENFYFLKDMLPWAKPIIGFAYEQYTEKDKVTELGYSHCFRKRELKKAFACFA